MSFGKKQKQQATQYERENQELGRQAYPQIQPTLDRIGDLTMNPDTYRKQYLNDYYNLENSAKWNDAQRQNLRTLNSATSRNYAATNGGYSSAGAKYYDDKLRAVNDANARLWDEGVRTAEGLRTNDLKGTQTYYRNLIGQHDLAQTADAIDTYNNVVDQANKRWWTEPIAQRGNVVESLPIGGYKYIGTGMKLGANALSKDYSDSLARLSGQFGGTSNPQAFKNSATGLAGLASGSVSNLLGDNSTVLGQRNNIMNNQKSRVMQDADGNLYEVQADGTLRRMPNLR